jgi:hypothetical protein
MAREVKKMRRFVIPSIINIVVMAIFNIAFFKITFDWLVIFFSISTMVQVLLLMRGYKDQIDRFILPYFISISLMSLYKTFFEPVTDPRALGAFGGLLGHLITQKLLLKRKKKTENPC